jgi:hypothetical protein
MDVGLSRLLAPAAGDDVWLREGGWSESDDTQEG